jgi:hypothetical protein
MAKDAYHEIVKRALIKDGWKITHDPFVIRYDDLWVYADLGAEKLLSESSKSNKIVIEIKVFGGNSKIEDFEKALGQITLYRTLMNILSFERQIFLAVSDEVYAKFFQRKAIQPVIEIQKINLLIFNVEEEIIIK